MTAQSEQIPDADPLYMRAHKNYFRDGELAPGVFRDHGAGMSTDWSRYATPADTRNRRRVPADNAVLSLVVGGVREIPGLAVQHTPQLDNDAHTDVFGEKTPEVRRKLLRICRIVLPL